MARVSPKEYYNNRGDAAGYSYENSGNRPHVPNPRHYDELGVSSHDKRELVGFERYVDNKGIQRQRGGGGPIPPAQYAPRHYTPKEYHYEGNTRGGNERFNALKPNPSDRLVEDQRSFIQFDCVAFLIILAWIIAMCSIVLGSLAYRKDTHWNGAVNGKRPLSKLRKEDYFSNKYLYFNPHEKDLKSAQQHLLRDDRWLELTHLIYLGTFLFLTLFQFAVYISRGKENHSASVKIYYAGFGLIGLICAFFPYSSWKTNESNYLKAAKHLHSFAERQWPILRSDHGLSNATANDAHRIALTMEFCKSTSVTWMTFNTKPPTIEHFGVKYMMEDMQELGFCTHNRFKVASAVLTMICAAFCCMIPFVYCMEHRDEDNKDRKVKIMPKYGDQEQQYRQYQPQPPRPPPEEIPIKHRNTYISTNCKLEAHYTHVDGTQLDENETNMICNFKEYIEAEED